MARGVRQGCPASGFLFAMAFRPYLSLAPRRDYSKEPCWPGLSAASSVFAYADDLAVAAPSFRDLVTGLAPAFKKGTE